MQEGKKKQVAAHFIDLAVYVDECVCVSVLMCVGALGGQQECLTPEASYSQRVWGLETDLGSSGRAASVLNC